MPYLKYTISSGLCVLMSVAQGQMDVSGGQTAWGLCV